MTQLNIVDSSGWLEYFADTSRAKLFSKAIENTDKLIVPVISIYEVFKKVLRDGGEDLALQIASVMLSGKVVYLDSGLALEAAHYGMPLTDSIIYATAIRYNATVWTQDADFKGLPNVQYFSK